jgi:hypothetical protein
MSSATVPPTPDPSTESTPTPESAPTAAPVPEPAAPTKESFGEKLLHGLEDVGEVAADIGLGAVAVLAEAGNPEGADALRDSEPHPHHEPHK